MAKAARLFFLIWWTLWAVLQFLFLRLEGIDTLYAIADAALSSALMFLANYAMVMLVRYFRPTLRNAISLLLASFLMAIAASTAIQASLRAIFDDQQYFSWLHSVFVIRLVIVWLMTIIAGINGWLFSFLQDQQKTELHRQESDRLLREAELSSLRQQLQPHFLFNSLNSISALLGSNPSAARKMIEQLSDFLRGTVKKSASQLVSLDEELRQVQLYLDIEKVRFGHRLSANIDADAATHGLKIPSLLLQPVLENAIKFGLYDTIGEVTITIRAVAQLPELVIEVTNPFDPATSIPKSGTGFGLSSVQRRLALLYHRNDLLATHQQDNRFTTVLRIPQLPTT